jgi:calcineurin-like phosphoesterase family protein
MASTFFTADTHFGHRNILRYCNRPWTTIEDHDAALVDAWNSVVGADDTVYHLGDVGLGSSELAFIPLLNGRKILLSGNHDSSWIKHAKHLRGRNRALAAGFTEVVSAGIVYNHALSDGTRINLAHLPYAGDSHDEDRYVDYRPTQSQSLGLPLLCGHVHDAWAIDGRQYNVGVDVRNYAPVTEDEIISWARSVR